MKSFFRRLPLYFDRSFSKGIGRQLIWLLLIMVAVYLLLILLSYIDFLYSPGSEDSDGRWYDIMFLLVDPGSASGSFMSAFALFVSVFGMIVFSGMLISVISNLLERRVDSYIAGENNYKLSDHIIVLGFNKSIPSLLERIFRDYEKSYILLMCNRNSNDVRDWIHANVDDSIEKFIIVMNGERDAYDDLDRLSLGGNPRAVYVLGEENEEGHDEKSLECLKKVSERIPERTDKIPCYVQINSSAIFSLLQQVDFAKKENLNRLLSFHPFNFNEIWAQKVLSLTSFDGEGYLPLDGAGIGPECDKHVHLIIIGMTALGKALAINAAQVFHFPNFKDGDFNTYTRITFIDPEADILGERFRNRYSTLFQLARWKSGDRWNDPIADDDSFKHLGNPNFMDIEWEFIQGDVANPSVRKYLEECCNDSRSMTTIALCGDDSERNLAICMGIPTSIFHGSALNMFLVRQQQSDIAVKMLEKIPLKSYKIRAFGMMNECYNENLLTDEYGKLINALYKDIDILNEAEKPEIEALWEEALITDKWSSNYSANMLFIKLRTLGFNDENISEAAIEEKLKSEEVQGWIQATEHNRWVTERILNGFIPLTLEEQAKFVMDGKSPKAEMRHQDICSNAKLKEINPKNADYDVKVNSKLWQLYQKSKLHLNHGNKG